MERIIDGRQPFGFGTPQFERLHRIIGPAGAAHFDQSCRPADQCRAAGRIVRVLCIGAHKRQIDVHVRVDETGKDISSLGVNHLAAIAGRYLDILGNPRDTNRSP